MIPLLDIVVLLVTVTVFMYGLAGLDLLWVRLTGHPLRKLI